MTKTELEKYKTVLETRLKELSDALRNREDIAIEKTPDALDEVQLAGERELAIRTLDRESALLRQVRGGMGGGGPAAELHVIERRDLPMARQGAGGVHHVAFRTPDDTQYEAWAKRLNELGVRNSGEVDRFYFRSLYFREPNGILFEIATDGPGFATDEPLATLGENLSLPPFLEGQRVAIESALKPLS